MLLVLLKKFEGFSFAKIGSVHVNLPRNWTNMVHHAMLKKTKQLKLESNGPQMVLQLPIDNNAVEIFQSIHEIC